MENNEAQAGSELSDRLGAITVPAKPEPERIESMCFRFDHGHGLRRWEETEEQFERRKEANRITMRQLYEEATGQGFYRPGRA